MKKIFWILVLVVAAVVFWMWWTGKLSMTAQDRGQKLVYDRLWVDHLPKTETDEINIMAAITEEPIGIFQKTSVWRGSFELFRYENSGDGKIVLQYPQTRDKERAAYRARTCSEAGFDFCLEFDGASRGVKRYYSQKGWELRSVNQASLERDVRTLLSITH